MSQLRLFGLLDDVTAGVTSLLSLDRTELLSAVSAQQVTPAALAGACTSAVADALPLVADGSTITSAVTSVESGHR